MIDIRDHRKLEAFRLAHQLVLAICRVTTEFPSHELFGLTSQMRRAAVSGAANIVEGSGRGTEADFVRFLDISFSSLQEVGYYIKLAGDLEYLSIVASEELIQKPSEAARKLAALIQYFRSWIPQDPRLKTQDHSECDQYRELWYPIRSCGLGNRV